MSLLAAWTAEMVYMSHTPPGDSHSSQDTRERAASHAILHAEEILHDFPYYFSRQETAMTQI